MKTSHILLPLVGLAALICLATCQKPGEAQEPFSIDVAKGQRLKLKPGSQKDPVAEFEKLLLSIPSAERMGTWVNLRREDGKEEEGPTADDKFVPPSQPIGPDGSIHNTQNIRVQNQAQFKDVLDSFDTSTPTPTPAR